MNITKSQIKERLDALQAIIASGQTIDEAVRQFGVNRYNIRQFMLRHGVPMPTAWVARKIKKWAGTKPNAPFLSDQRLPADRLTDDELDAAYRFGIHPERMAWLLSCEYSGTAYGLTSTRTIKRSLNG